MLILLANLHFLLKYKVLRTYSITARELSIGISLRFLPFALRNDFLVIDLLQKLEFSSTRKSKDSFI